MKVMRMFTSSGEVTTLVQVVTVTGIRVQSFRVSIVT